MKHELLQQIGIVCRQHEQGKGEPPLPAPEDGAVHDAPKAGRRPVGLRLVCGVASSPWVKDHQRTTQRHTPEPARVALAELGDLIEPSLGNLWLDLCIRSHCRAKTARATADG